MAVPNSNRSRELEIKQHEPCRNGGVFCFLCYISNVGIKERNLKLKGELICQKIKQQNKKQ